MAVTPGPVREAILRFKVDLKSVAPELAKLKGMIAEASRGLAGPGAVGGPGAAPPSVGTMRAADQYKSGLKALEGGTDAASRAQQRLAAALAALEVKERGARATTEALARARIAAHDAALKAQAITPEQYLEGTAAAKQTLLTSDAVTAQLRAAERARTEIDRLRTQRNANTVRILRQQERDMAATMRSQAEAYKRAEQPYFERQAAMAAAETKLQAQRRALVGTLRSTARAEEYRRISPAASAAQQFDALNRALQAGTISQGEFTRRAERLRPALEGAAAGASRADSAIGRFTRQIVRHLSWIASAIVLYGTWRAASNALREAISTQQQVAMAQVYQPRLDWSPETLKKLSVFTRAYGGDMSAATEAAALWAKKTGDLNSALYLTGEALKFQRATGQQLEETYRSGIALASQLGMSLRDVPELWNTIAAATLRTGGSTRQFREDAGKEFGFAADRARSMAEEISRALGQSSAALRTLGFTGSQQIAIVAALAERLDANFQMVGERLPRMLEAFRDPQLVQWLAQVGIRVDLTTDGLRRMAQAYDSLGASEQADLAAKMGNRREYQIALNFLAAWTGALKLADEIEKDKTATDRLVMANLRTMGGQIDRVKASWEAMTTMLLVRALPALTRYTNILASAVIPALGSAIGLLQRNATAWAAVTAAIIACLPWSRAITLTLGTSIPAAFGKAGMSAAAFATAMVARFAIVAAVVWAVANAIEAVEAALDIKAHPALAEYDRLLAAQKETRRIGRDAVAELDRERRAQQALREGGLGAAMREMDKGAGLSSGRFPGADRTQRMLSQRIAAAQEVVVEEARKAGGEVGKALVKQVEAEAAEYDKALAKAGGDMAKAQAQHYSRLASMWVEQAKEIGPTEKMRQQMEIAQRNLELLWGKGKFPTLKAGPEGGPPPESTQKQGAVNQAQREYLKLRLAILDGEKEYRKAFELRLGEELTGYAKAMALYGVSQQNAAALLQRLRQLREADFDAAQMQRVQQALQSAQQAEEGLAGLRQQAAQELSAMAQAYESVGMSAEAAALREQVRDAELIETRHRWRALLAENTDLTEDETEAIIAEVTARVHLRAAIDDAARAREKENAATAMALSYWQMRREAAEASRDAEAYGAAKAKEQQLSEVQYRQQTTEALIKQGYSGLHLIIILERLTGAWRALQLATAAASREQLVWSAEDERIRAQRGVEDLQLRTRALRESLMAPMMRGGGGDIEATRQQELRQLALERERVDADYERRRLGPYAERAQITELAEAHLADVARINEEIVRVNLETTKTYRDAWVQAFDQISDRWSQTVVENIGKGRGMAQAMLDLYRGLGAEWLTAQFKRLPAFQQMVSNITDLEMRGKGGLTKAEIESRVRGLSEGEQVQVDAQRDNTTAIRQLTQAITTGGAAGAGGAAPLPVWDRTASAAARTAQGVEGFRILGNKLLDEQGLANKAYAHQPSAGDERLLKQNQELGKYLQGISAVMALQQASKTGDWLGGAAAGAALGSVFGGTAFGIGFGPIGAAAGLVMGLFGGGGSSKQPEQLPMVRPELWRRGDVEWALPVRAPASAYYGGRAGSILQEPADQHSEVHLHGDLVLPNVRDARTFERELRELANAYSGTRSRGVGRNLPSVR